MKLLISNCENVLIFQSETITSFKVKHYTHINYNGMKAKLDHTDWGDILGTSTINHQWLGFKEYIKKIEDEFIPHRLVSNINRHKGKVPLNKESVRKIKKKHTLWKRYMETKERKCYTEYCRARSQVCKLTRRIQKEFEMMQQRLRQTLKQYGNI